MRTRVLLLPALARRNPGSARESRKRRPLMTQQPFNASTEDADKKKSKILVAGASGLIGVAAIEAFLSAGWDVVGISRRKPALPSGRSFDFMSVDLRDEHASREALSSLSGVTHIAY